jgi:phosphoserine phosphatase RsbU/P
MVGRSAHLGAAERVRSAPMSRTVRALDQLAVELCLQQAAGVVVQAEDGTVLDHNDAAAGVLRMSPDQLVGASSLDDNWAAVTLDDEPIAGERHPAMRALATDRPVRNFTMGVRGGDDTYRWLRVDSWPTRLDGARVVITQFLDITDEVEARRAVDLGLERLQRHVVPRAAPEIPGLLVHLRYRNLVEPLEVGGDFCDIYQASRRRYGFFIGDAAGHDLDTVATTMVAHHTLRATGLHLARPGRVLRWLHDTLMATDDSVYCSAIHGSIRLDTHGEIRIELANAGHPRPILMSESGARSLDPAGSIAGAHASFRQPPSVPVHLAPGDRLVMYTDGLLESLTPRLEPEEFLGHLDDVARHGTPVMDLIDDMIRRADRTDVLRRDDTAVLVLEATTAPVPGDAPTRDNAGSGGPLPALS